MGERSRHRHVIVNISRSTSRGMQTSEERFLALSLYASYKFQETLNR